MLAFVTEPLLLLMPVSSVDLATVISWSCWGSWLPCVLALSGLSPDYLGAISRRLTALLHRHGSPCICDVSTIQGGIRNTMKYQEIPRNIRNAKKYKEIPRNTGNIKKLNIKKLNKK